MWVKVKAIIWLHTLRLWRYSLSFLNMILSQIMWVLLFMMGVLLFVPPEHMTIALRMAYWTIAAWSIISSFSSLVGGWTSFFIIMGMVEEHLLRSTSPFTTILGRVLTGTTVSFAIIIIMGYSFGWMFGRELMAIQYPHLMVLGFTLLVVESLSYALSVSAASMRTSVSEQFLEILNFGIIGLLIVPMGSLPGPARRVYLAIPYVAPAYIIKASVGAEALGFLDQAVMVGSVESVLMVVASLKLMQLAEDYIRRNGVRAVGFW